MRRKLVYLLLTVLVLFSCSSKKKLPQKSNNNTNTTGWVGIYRGVLPCADCAGIQTEVKLNADNTYLISRSYLGKSIELLNDTGIIKWMKKGSAIELISNTYSKSQFKFKVVENGIVLLDKDEKPLIDSANQLTKAGTTATLLNTHWKLNSLGNIKLKEDTSQRTKPYIMLFANGSKVSGYGGCNYFNGNFETAEGNRLFFSKMINTLRACKNMQTELEFLYIFEQVNSYAIKSNTLFLYDRNRITLAQFIPVYLIN